MATDVEVFRAWRRLERGKRQTVVVGAVIVAVIVVVLAITVSRGGGGVKQPTGRLPTIAEVERELKIWAVPGRRGILRGRPLFERRMTRDASSIDSRFRGPAYSLWENSEGEVVAFSCFVMSERLWDAMTFGETLGDDAAERHVAAWRFLRKYVGLDGLSDFAFRLTEREETFGTIEQNSLARESMDGFEIEVTREKRFEAGRQRCDWEYDLIIVKGANW